MKEQNNFQTINEPDEVLDESVDVEMLKSLIDDNVRTIEAEAERLNEQHQMLCGFQQVVEQNKAMRRDIERLNLLVDDADRQAEQHNREMERLREENKALRTERDTMKMQLTELGKMAGSMVKKADNDKVIEIFRRYLNASKRKQASKKGYIRMVIMEMTQNAGIVLPADMQATLEAFDDDVPAINIDEVTLLKQVEHEIGNVEPGGMGVAMR